MGFTIKYHQQPLRKNPTKSTLTDPRGDGMLDFFASHRVLAHQD